MRALYPPIEPRRSTWLESSGGHRVYVEECGAPDGLPVVFLHGGPGSGCKPSHRQFFDPRRYRVFLVDQRGCGRSTPLGGLQANTTAHLVDDLEALRRWGGVARWGLFGGSWGAALALTYAQHHPQRVLGMVLRGTFLARARDMAWFLAEGAGRLLPQAWERFVESTRDVGQDIPSLHAAICGDDTVRALRIARAWSTWSTEVVMYAFDTAPAGSPEGDEALLAKTRIELHYAHAGYFLRDNQLLDEIARIPRVPTWLIHGQRDITCAPEAGWAVHRALPGSTIEMLRTAGHLSGESSVQDALLRAADAMRDTLGETWR
ncbi:MAG: prolyl aminopeptidase [Gammaproteobacteria bacterium]